MKLNAEGVTFGGKVYLKLFVYNVIISKEEIRVSGPKGIWRNPLQLALYLQQEIRCPVLFGSGVPWVMKLRTGSC